MTILKRGTQVICVPPGANGNKEHADCQIGFLSMDHESTDDIMFVRYWNPTFTGLRTKANSEATKREYLVFEEYLPQSWVQEAIDLLLKDG